MSSLTTTVLRFQRNGTGYEQIQRRVSLLVYDFPDNRHGLDEDVRGDFLLYMLPRLPAIIGRYRKPDVPFEHFLSSCMRWKLKSFLRARAKRQQRARLQGDILLAREIHPGLPVCEPTSPTLKTPLDMPVKSVSDIADFNRKNAGLLYFCMKAICDVSEERVPRVAAMCNVNAAWLMHMRELLIQRCRHRRYRLASLREKQQLLYARIREAQEQLLFENSPDQKIHHRERIARLDRSYRRISRAAENTNLRPSNRDIAHLLGVPKGSVDSGVAKARDVLSGVVAEQHDG